MADQLGADGRGAATSVATEPPERFVLATRPECPRRAVYLALAGDIVLLLAFVGISLLGDRVPRMFDLDGEKNIPTWYASAKLLAVAALLALVALNAGRRDRLTQLVLLMPVALFVFLSIDEVASIHEMLGGNIDSMVTDTPDRAEMVFHITGYWMFVLGPMLAAAMVAMGIAYHRLVRPSAAIMRLAALGAGVFLRCDRGRDRPQLRRASLDTHASGDARGGDGADWRQPDPGGSGPVHRGEAPPDRAPTPPSEARSARARRPGCRRRVGAA
jgi:hypothetical protein